MPVYLTLASLIFDKRAVEQKYKGGVEQFCVDYFNNESKASDEDDEVFLIARMNSDEYDIERYIKMGFEYNEEKGFSNDFVIHQRYHGYLWKVDWIEDNEIFAWHINTPQVLKCRVNEMIDISVDEFSKLENPYESLTIENIDTHSLSCYVKEKK